jgi:hypothetical protein
MLVPPNQLPWMPNSSAVALPRHNFDDSYAWLEPWLQHQLSRKREGSVAEQHAHLFPVDR